MKNIFTLLLLLISTMPFSQVLISNYEGNWEGNLSSKELFSLDISLEVLQNNYYKFSISAKEQTIVKMVKSTDKESIQIAFGDKVHFSGSASENDSEINGFIKSGILLYHVLLKKSTKGKYIGKWNIFMLDELKDQSIYLSVENANGASYEAYPFFGDQRFTGTWCTNFEKDSTSLYFHDFKTGLQFTGNLGDGIISLELHIGELVLAQVILERSIDEWNWGNPASENNRQFDIPENLHDGWEVADIKALKVDDNILNNMLDSIYKNAITNTHSVLIAQKGKLVFEKYFSGYNENIPHDQRSAAKSISSAITGVAIDQQIIKNVAQKIYDFLPKRFQYTKDSLKSNITIKDLLTMSSGIDAIDFGIERNSVASENNYQNSPDWVKTVLEAPMIFNPGEHANYGSANPFLLGILLDELIEQPLELFIDQALLSPLGISNYILQADIGGCPYFGGGMYLTPRDMLKFGQLYLDKGEWNGKRIISKQWVEASIQKYLVLENANDKNEYGYLWWHKSYEVHGRQIAAIEARGAGGQYISLIPELDLVVAITSGNFRNGRFWQPEQIIEKYILPAMISESNSTLKN